MSLNMKNFDFKARGVWRNGESWRMEEFLEDGRAVLVYIEKSCAKFAKNKKKKNRLIQLMRRCRVISSFPSLHFYAFLYNENIQARWITIKVSVLISETWTGKRVAPSLD